MCDVLISLLAGLTSTLRTRASLQVEILALRHQLAVLQRSKPKQVVLRLAGSQEMVAVRQLSMVIESRISGAFEGWQGESEYELTNGMVWKQQHYEFEYKYSYQPTVLIYDTPSGKVMDVDECRATVRRVR